MPGDPGRRVGLLGDRSAPTTPVDLANRTRTAQMILHTSISSDGKTENTYECPLCGALVAEDRQARHGRG